MKDETKNKIAALTFENLPAEIEGFALKKIFAVDEDKFIFFSYVDDENHCALTAYFHEETMEFKILQRIGLTEFCLTKFFTEDFAHFKELINSELEDVIVTLDGQVSHKVQPNDEIVVRKSKTTAQIVKFEDKNYYDVLKAKMWSSGT